MPLLGSSGFWGYAVGLQAQPQTRNSADSTSVTLFSTGAKGLPSEGEECLYLRASGLRLEEFSGSP